jgi:hypothetical protein
MEWPVNALNAQITATRVINVVPPKMFFFHDFKATF